MKTVKVCSVFSLLLVSRVGQNLNHDYLIAIIILHFQVRLPDLVALRCLVLLMASAKQRVSHNG